ncbi:MAG: RcnB family protein [Alphaproteobacteria bacterium]|jgi:Ni/Co efflux regulator RcnB|nr:RcnB family protein [Alphaproteobacteria bacterium]
MKYVLPAVGVALALALSGTAYAADHERGQRGNRDQATQQNDNGHRFNRGDRQRAPVAQQQPQRTQWQGQRNGDNNRWRNNDRPRGPVVNNNGRPPVVNNNWRNNRPPVANNNWRNNNARANWNQYRRNYNSPRRFRVGAYHGPRNFHYQRWSYGQRLPAAYYARQFWLFDVIGYGLFTPPPGLIWVRYGDDALLIDQYTGEIVQVRYDVFY